VLAKGVIPRYLSSNLGKINLGEEIRALVRVRCRNLRECGIQTLARGREKNV